MPAFNSIPWNRPGPGSTSSSSELHDIELNHDLPRSYLLPHRDNSTTTLNEDRSQATASKTDIASLLSSKAKRQFSAKRSSSGWHFGAKLSLAGAVLVFMLNLSLTIWASTLPSDKAPTSIRTLHTGSCTTVRRLNVAIHLLVNVLSTLLLCASNYCMQVLVAPNRAEVDRAHSQKNWLHIGAQSLHNLRLIAPDRALLWTLLMLSSLPLHLFYNSVIFINLQANIYAAVPTYESWILGEDTYDFTRYLGFESTQISALNMTLNGYVPNLYTTVKIANKQTKEVNRYQNVSIEECFNSYNNHYVSAVGTVFLVHNEPVWWRNSNQLAVGVSRDNGSLRWYEGAAGNPPENYVGYNFSQEFPFVSRPSSYPSNVWRCRSHRTDKCNVGDANEVATDRSKWAPYGSPLRYCLQERVPEICQLRFSLLFAGIVLAGNSIKIFCFAVLLYGYKHHNALVTLGDALASFLERPDPETRSRCLHSLAEIEAHWNGGSKRPRNRTRRGDRELLRPPDDNVSQRAKLSKYWVHVEVKAEPKRYMLRSRRWGHAPCDERWYATYIFYFVILIFGIITSTLSVQNLPRTLKELWDIGFGSVNGQNLLSTSMSVTGGVILANSPQITLSYLYLAFNYLYTTMLVGHEWSGYMTNRKCLRVTSPSGRQRDTYWLSVPYRYAIPITLLSGLLHWLVSQSIFMVQITVFDTKTRSILSDQQISSCGFSPLAIIMATIVTSIMAAGGVVMGSFKYPAGMPLVGSCSAAISASCHPPDTDMDAQLRPVQWGAVTHGEDGDGEQAIGHCTFSSLVVDTPISGHLYA